MSSKSFISWFSKNPLISEHRVGLRRYIKQNNPNHQLYIPPGNSHEEPHSSIIQSIPDACVGTIYESCDHGALRGRVQQTERRPALALKVTQGSTPLQSLPVWLCHWHYDFITPEKRGRERKKNSLHSSVNVHLKFQLNQSPAGINREQLSRLGAGGG